MLLLLCLKVDDQVFLNFLCEKLQFSSIVSNKTCLHDFSVKNDNIQIIEKFNIFQLKFEEI